MERKAVIVAGAAGSDVITNGVLQRAGFAPAIGVPSVALALQVARDEQADLLIVPLQGSDAADLSTLEREIGRNSRTFVIGTAPAPEPDLILRALRAGIHEFLVYPPSADDLATAVDRMDRRARPEAKSKLTVAVYSAKGGTGTTTVAVNLAYALAQGQRNVNVALADFVVSGGDVGILLNLRPTYTIADLALKLEQLDSSLLDSVLVRSVQDANVSVLAASDQPETLETVDGLAAGRILEEFRAHFSYTVIDCEHHPTNRTIAALDSVERVMLVTQLNVAAVRSTQRSLGLLRQLGYDDDKVVVVANRAQSSDLIAPADAEKVLDRDLFYRLPNDYRTCEAALTRGLPVVTHAPTTPLARAYVALANKLRGDVAGVAAPGETIVQQGSRFGRLLGIGRK